MGLLTENSSSGEECGGLVVRASDCGARDWGFDAYLCRVVSLSKTHLLPKSTGNTQEAVAPSRHDWIVYWDILAKTKWNHPQDFWIVLICKLETWNFWFVDKSNMSLVLRKPVFRVSNQVRHKRGSAVTKDGYRLEISDLESRGIVPSM